MRTIVVDDRQLAVNALVGSLKELDPEGSHAGLISPQEALSYASTHTLDAAFLDVEMPSMSGLDLAKQLQKLQPDMKFVLVTGHTEYALDAIRSHIISDYLVKPVADSDLKKSLDHLRGTSAHAANGKIRVRCFGSFEVFINDEPVFFKRSKSKELFAYLVDARGSFCSMGELMSALWEDGEVTTSRNSQIRTFISDIRHVLEESGFEDVIIKEHNVVALRLDDIDCDYFKYMDRDPDAMHLYTGEYMRQYSWAEMRISDLTEI
ncbi:MAG: response regulator [Lachnospiraceae bacterium]|nr:response regulator [Lachnospiraceae bacterium]